MPWVQKAHNTRCRVAAIGGWGEEGMLGRKTKGEEGKTIPLWWV